MHFNSYCAAGQKKAREIWFLSRFYDAREALAMGLVNTVVPLAELEPETLSWCAPTPAVHVSGAAPDLWLLRPAQLCQPQHVCCPHAACRSAAADPAGAGAARS